MAASLGSGWLAFAVITDVLAALTMGSDKMESQSGNLNYSRFHGSRGKSG